MNVTKCQCQDSSGHVCNVVMTKQEIDQDGMCSFCADHVWYEITFEGKGYYVWYHHHRKDGRSTK